MKAEKLLRQWRDGIFETVEPIDFEAFAEQFAGADINRFRLSNDDSILGLTCFEDRPAKALTEDEDGEQVVAEHEDMIIVCPHAFDEGDEARGRLTIAHECSHVLLHTAANMDDAQTLAAHTVNVDPKVALSDDRKVSNWVEWQANRMTVGRDLDTRQLYYEYQTSWDEPAGRYETIRLGRVS